MFSGLSPSLRDRRRYVLGSTKTSTGGFVKPVDGLLQPALIVGGLLILTLIIFRQQLFSHWTFPWDFVGAYTTTPAYVAAAIGDGHLPAWSPYVASGFPVAVDAQAGVYFPGWWALGILHIPATLRVLSAVQAAHVLFGATGVLALSRARRLGWSWAALAAVAYLFFGGFYGEAEHADIFRGFAYLPWLLWALTPAEGQPWWRLAAVPPIAWLIATGAYPGELVSFGIAGLVYLGVCLRTAAAGTWRRYRVALLLSVIAAGAVSLAALLPYLIAEHGNQLVRIEEPTAAVRAGASLAPRDLLGLFLNNFAWTYDGTVTSWAVGVPVLIGLACTRMETLRRQAPLAIVAVVALALAMTPKIGFIGRAMASVRPLFPSRFPAADYKSIVAVGLIVIAADSWCALAARRRGLWPRAVLAGTVLVLAAILAPSGYGSPTRVLWLVLVVIAACVLLVVVRLPSKLLLGALVVLAVVDGGREIYDYRLLNSISPWRVSPADSAPYRARDVSVRELGKVLEQAPERRPARVGPAAPLATAPTGTDPDAEGWIAAGYHLNDYGGTYERTLWRAEHNPTLLTMLLAPWTGYTFSCATVKCAAKHVSLPAPRSWRASGSVRTVSYGEERITYSVDLAAPAVLVENELAIPGWRSSSSRVAPIDTDLPLRAWRLSAGRYTFTTTYRQPGRVVQGLLALLALLAWIAAAAVLYRRRASRASTA
jgi:hypothetical protein